MFIFSNRFILINQKKFHLLDVTDTDIFHFTTNVNRRSNVLRSQHNTDVYLIHMSDHCIFDELKKNLSCSCSKWL